MKEAFTGLRYISSVSMTPSAGTQASSVTCDSSREIPML